MSKRLMGVIQRFLIVDKMGVTKIALAVEKQEQTVQRWINAERIPEANDRYKVALACGCNEKEALELAQELPEAKETA